jgi:hypothetical protein
MRRLPLATSLVAAVACSSASTPDPTFDYDFDAARARWAGARPSSYSFELLVTTAWVRPDGFDRIDVQNGVVAAVRHLDTGATRPAAGAPTIDSIYAQLAAARARGEALSQLRFDRAGVPLEAMYGTFANDGGVHYEVRGFTRGR